MTKPIIGFIGLGLMGGTWLKTYRNVVTKLL